MTCGREVWIVGAVDTNWALGVGATLRERPVFRSFGVGATLSEEELDKPIDGGGSELSDDDKGIPVCDGCDCC